MVGVSGRPMPVQCSGLEDIDHLRKDIDHLQTRAANLVMPDRFRSKSSSPLQAIWRAVRSWLPSNPWSVGCGQSSPGLLSPLTQSDSQGLWTSIGQTVSQVFRRFFSYFSSGQTEVSGPAKRHPALQQCYEGIVAGAATAGKNSPPPAARSVQPPPAARLVQQKMAELLQQHITKEMELYDPSESEDWQEGRITRSNALHIRVIRLLQDNKCDNYLLGVKHPQFAEISIDLFVQQLESALQPRAQLNITKILYAFGYEQEEFRAAIDWVRKHNSTP